MKEGSGVVHRARRLRGVREIPSYSGNLKDSRKLTKRTLPIEKSGCLKFNKEEQRRGRIWCWRSIVSQHSSSGVASFPCFSQAFHTDALLASSSALLIAESLVFYPQLLLPP